MLLTISVPAPVCSLDQFVAVGLPGPLLLWDAEGAALGFAGRGEAVRIDVQGTDRFRALRDRASAVLSSIVQQRRAGAQDAPAPRLFGGLAFAPMESVREPWGGFADASLVLPRWLYVRSRQVAWLQLTLRSDDEVAAVASSREMNAVLGQLANEGAVGPPPASAPVVEETSDARFVDPNWRALVGDALGRIERRQSEKLVAARCRVMIQPRPIDVAGVLARLSGARASGCVRFAFERARATFLGVTPERLIRVTGRTAETEAVAATATDAAGLARDKERREHALVVSGIRRTLEPLCDRLDCPSVPDVRVLPGLQHLWTPIRGELREPRHVLDLAGRLHPTAAVSGSPRADALRWIAEHEPEPRGWYAGPVGWVGREGDGELAVAIRSGVVRGRRAWLWAGAGIVAGSDPEAEWRETCAKQAPLLRALGAAA